MFGSPALALGVRDGRARVTTREQHRSRRVWRRMLLIDIVYVLQAPGEMGETTEVQSTGAIHWGVVTSLYSSKSKPVIAIAMIELRVIAH